MLLECKQLFDIVGETVNIDYQMDLSEYELFLTHPFTAPVLVKGKVQNRAGVVTLCYETDFSLSLSCDRCNEPFSRDYHYSFEQILVSSLSSADNDEYILVETGKLDLDELVLSDILLNLPSKLLCSPHCKGLCQKCGANLNQTVCLCAKKEIDPRLAVLSDLL